MKILLAMVVLSMSVFAITEHYGQTLFPPGQPNVEMYSIDTDEQADIVYATGQTSGSTVLFHYIPGPLSLGIFAERIQETEFSGIVDETWNFAVFYQGVRTGNSYPINPSANDDGSITGTVNFNNVPLTISVDTVTRKVRISETNNSFNAMERDLSPDDRYRIKTGPYTYIGGVLGQSLTDIEEWVDIGLYNVGLP